MITDELLDFLRTQYASGTPRAELERMLISEGGWEKTDIDQAFTTLGIVAAPVTPPISIPESNPVQDFAAPETNALVASVEPVQQTAPQELREQQELKSIQEVRQEEPIVLNVRSVREDTAPLTEVHPIEAEVLARESINHSFSEPTEDFLGIFSGSTSPHHEESVHLEAASIAPALSVEQTPVIATPPQVLATPEPESKAEAEAESQIVRDTRPTIESAKSMAAAPKRSLQEMLAQVSAPATPEPLPTAIVGNEDIALDTIEKRDLVAPQTSTGIKFDLSQLRKATAVTPEPVAQVPLQVAVAEVALPVVSTVQPPAAPATASSEKPIETKSVAELWLNKREAPSTIVGRRTMSSDILLRGKGAAIQGIPSISVPEDRPEQGMSAESQIQPASVVEAPAVFSPPASPVVKAPPALTPPRVALADDLSRKHKIKKVIGILGGILLLLLIIGGAAFGFMFLRGPNVDALFTTTFTKFLSATSFVYNGSASSDLVLSAASDGVVRNGLVKFNLGYGGQVKNGNDGYGDGVHHVKFKGGLQSGNFKWSTDVESDVRMLANSLYFHVLSFPTETGIDPEVFKAYWIKIDLEEIAKELALSGVSTQPGYGSFGTASKDMTFAALLTKNLPWSGGEKLTDEPVNGVNAMHFKLKTDPEKMLSLTNALYKKYTGKDLSLDNDQQLRLKNALAKVNAEVWIDATTNTLQKFSLNADLDDDIVGVHVKGKVNMDFTFSLYNTPVSVPDPTPLLTLEELQSRMSDYQHSKDARSADGAKLKLFSLIQDALALYQKDMGRYPTVLSELRAEGRLATSTMDDVSLRQFYFASYVKPDLLIKTNKCNAKIKSCTTYHLGVNLDDQSDPELSNDSDQTGEINGDDHAGCGNEPNKSCYDVVVPNPTGALR